MIEDHRIQKIPIPVGYGVTGYKNASIHRLTISIWSKLYMKTSYAVVDRIINQVKKNHAKKLKTIIEEEARVYSQNEFVTYRTNPSSP